jgi:hypothetical protein
MLQAIITLLYYRNVHDMIVMTIHSALAAQHAQKYARDDPCVLMGDFNFMPGSPQYDLLTKGDMDAQVSRRDRQTGRSIVLCSVGYSIALSSRWTAYFRYHLCRDCCCCCCSIPTILP